MGISKGYTLIKTDVLEKLINENSLLTQECLIHEKQIGELKQICLKEAKYHEECNTNGFVFIDVLTDIFHFGIAKKGD